MKNDKTTTLGDYPHLDAEHPDLPLPKPSDRLRPSWLEPCPMSGAALSAMVAEITG